MSKNSNNSAFLYSLIGKSELTYHAIAVDSEEAASAWSAARRAQSMGKPMPIRFSTSCWRRASSSRSASSACLKRGKCCNNALSEGREEERRDERTDERRDENWREEERRVGGGGKEG